MTVAKKFSVCFSVILTQKYRISEYMFCSPKQTNNSLPLSSLAIPKVTVDGKSIVAQEILGLPMLCDISWAGIRGWYAMGSVHGLSRFEINADLQAVIGFHVNISLNCPMG